jgi:SAM-dependent methyltransferase
MLGSGSQPSFTPEELVNIATFATDSARAQYDVYGLSTVEESLVRRYFTDPRARLLDIGCGYGRTTVPLQELGYRVVGIDVVERMVVQAEKKHPYIPWLLMSATDLALRDHSVTYAFFPFNGIDCIYPLHRRDQALREVYRVLRPGGCFIYSTHNWLAQIVTSLRNHAHRSQVLYNLRRAHLFSGYLRVPQTEGDLVLYYGTPCAEIRRLRRLGFRRITLHQGKMSPQLKGWGHLGSFLFDARPHFVAYR